MKTKKILRNTLLVVTGFVVILIVLAELFKDDVVKLALEKGAKTFDVPLGVGEVDLSLIYRFPLATIEFNDLVMLGAITGDSLSQPIDTVAGISKLYASVDMVALMKGDILVKKIEIQDVKAKYIVDSLGKSNFDFLLEGSSDSAEVVVNDTTKIRGVYSLDKLKLSNVELDYVDSFLNAAGQIYISSLEMNGEVQANGFKAATEGEVFINKLHFQQYQLETLNNSQLNFSVTALNDTISISQFNLMAGGSKLNLKGNYFKTDSAQLDIQFAAQGVDLAQNLAILPPKMIQEYKVSDIEGQVSVEGSAKGYLTENTLPNLGVKINLSNGKAKYDNYPLLKNIAVSAHFISGQNDIVDSAFINVEKLYAETGQSSIDMQAKILNAKNINYDITANVNANFQDFKGLIPDSLLKDVSGSFKASLSTSGIMPDSIDDKFTDYALDRSNLELSMNDISVIMDSIPEIHNLSGSIAYHPRKVILKDLKLLVPDYGINLTNAYFNTSFKGKISDCEHLEINMDSVFVKSSNSSIYAAGKIKGLKNIEYDLKSKLNIDLAEWEKAVPDSLITSMSGNFNADIKSKGKFHIDSVADNSMALLFENSKFGVELKQLMLGMPDSLMSVNQLSAKVNYKEDTLMLDKVIGNYMGVNFSADSTSVAGIYSAAILNQPKELVVNGNFEVGDMDYVLVEPFLPQDSLEKIEENLIEKEDPYVMNFSYKANGRILMKSFKYEGALFQNISTKFFVKPGYYVADDFNLNAFNGNLIASAKYQEFGEDKAMLSFKAEANRMDINKLLIDFRNFDQNEIIADNISGLFSGQVFGETPLRNYEMITDSFNLTGNLKLEEGGLYNYKPVMEIQKIPGVGFKNMDNLRFSTINSSIFIFRGKMYVPNTEIRTTSFDAAFLGMQSFQEDYQYHIRVFLGEVLASKSKGALERQAKEGGFEKGATDTKGRTSLYLKSFKKAKKERSGLDNKIDRKNMKIEIMLQESSLKLNFVPRSFTFKTGIN